MEKFTVGYADLEKKLIENFKIDFYANMGYYPVVITNDFKRGETHVMTLTELENYFFSFYPRSKNNRFINLMSKNRTKEIVELRCIFVYLARSMDYKLVEISSYLKKHHTTIIHNLDTFNNRMQTSPEFREIFNNIYNYIKSNYLPNDYVPAMEYFDKIWHKSRPTILS